MEVKIFDNKELVAEAVAELLVDISEKESTSIALSGGSTPKLLFQLLAKNYADKIQWNNLHFFWGDERCVPPDDDDSNYKMTKIHLLDKISIPDKNVHRIHGEDDPKEESERYGDEIASFHSSDGIPEFDLIILGMGTDGHTASVFPHQMHLLKEKSICAVAIHPDSGQKRVTLTGTIINKAKRVLFLVTGDDKSEKVSEILSEKGKYKDYPASYIKPSGKLEWFLDSKAASLI